MNARPSHYRAIRRQSLLAALMLFLASAAVVWRVLPSSPRAVLPAGIQVIGLSPDGKFLVTQQGGRATVRNMDTGEPVAELPGDISAWPAHRFTFSPDGRLLAGHGDGRVTIWDLQTGEERAAVPIGESAPHDPGPGITFAPNSRWVVLQSRQPDDTTRVTVLDVSEWTEHLAIRTERAGSLCFSPDGSILAFESWEPKPGQPPLGRLRVWDLAARSERPALDTEDKPLRSLAFSPDGRLLATGERQRYQWAGAHEVVVWDLESRNRIGRWDVPKGVRRFQFNARGTHLWVGTLPAPELSSGPAVVFLIPRPALAVIELARTAPGNFELIKNADVQSPNGRFLLRPPPGADDPATVHDLEVGAAVGSFYPIQGDERWVPREFSPDGGLFAVVASIDPNSMEDSEPQPWELRLFETHTGKLAAAVPVVDSTPVWFTPDGSRVVVLAPDKSPTIWDVPPARPWGRILLWWGIVAGAIVVGLALLWWRSGRRERLPDDSNPGVKPVSPL